MDPADASLHTTWVEMPQYGELPRNIGRGAVAAQALTEAAEAVKQEWRAQRVTVRMHAIAVEVAGDESECMYRIDVPRFGDMNWAWEGARACRPRGMDGLDFTWAGEVVEVDESGGSIYVRVDAETVRPVAGSFLVTPFDYLEALKTIYCDQGTQLQAPLLQALALSSRELRPHKLETGSSLPELRESWPRSAGFLWGPPGTGKTYRIGQQVATALSDPAERILVVSTTNQATDSVALSIGFAISRSGGSLDRHVVSRVGAGADITVFREAGFEELLVGGEAWLRERLAVKKREYNRLREPERRARLHVEIQQIQQQIASGRPSLGEVDSRVVVSTAFSALRDLATPEGIAVVSRGCSRFTTIIIDEAGLISRATAAALSLYAARRVYLVGDHKQLSPISRISRVLPQHQARWIASSALDGIQAGDPGVDMLREQYRMHPHIRGTVSAYQYDGNLTDAEPVTRREHPIPRSVANGHRAVWYVLDEDTDDVSRIRAERGPGNKSWVRARTATVLERMFRAHPELAAMQGLFVSPFAAQARAIGSALTELAPAWKASTTHRQQGAEADVVVVDTVNATSTAWPHHEWKRLVNVSMSRARHLLVVLASRAEMAEPYLESLAEVLSPQVLRGIGGQLRWIPISGDRRVGEAAQTVARPHTFGEQLERRKALRPVLSAEQQRLAAFALDGKPRLVRGVAGSGKTAVLASWLARWVAEQDAAGPYWVVYGNSALRPLLQRAIADAWVDLGRTDDLPWNVIHMFHIVELLDTMEGMAGIRVPRDMTYELEFRANTLLARDVQPACKALFIDEAQDFGEATIQYLTRLVQQSGPGVSDRAINIFFDNAQNVYGRGTPRWSELGIDMRGRSTVMKESFRSTRPITEFALNTLYRLVSHEDDPDHRELVQRDLIELEARNGRPWWGVRYNSVDGPAPEFKKFGSRDDEMTALCTRVVQWICVEDVRPGDIRIIANDEWIRRRIVRDLGEVVAPLGITVEEQSRAGLTNDPGVLVVTTAHSFKGYESEIVVVAAADRFMSKKAAVNNGVLSAPLYVAMTRARSLLYVSSIVRAEGSPANAIVIAAQEALEDLLSPPREAPACTPVELLLEFEARLGEQHRGWLRSLASGHGIRTGPLVGPGGEIVAEPLFWIESGSRRRACFMDPPSTYMVNRLDDLGIEVLTPGQA